MKALVLATPFLAATASCVTPPVVMPASNEDWSLERSVYPLDAQIMELERPDGPTLRGLYVPSDAGAPLVVHYAESAASICSSVHTRDQYEALAEIGFASLALDYRGVGLSDGEPSPPDLAADARAMYAFGLSLVDGDEGRLLVRGTSLGTLAIASVLEAGGEPAAVVMIAPVLAESVAVRYGFATMWDPLVWIARPFLRSFLSADLVEELGECPSPLLVYTCVEDELLSRSEHAAIHAAVERAGGRIEETKKFMRFTVDGVPETEQLEWHIGLSLTSFALRDPERSLLRDLFPLVPPMVDRRDQVLSAGDPRLAARVRADERASANLLILCTMTRRFEADAYLAAALHGEDALQAYDLLETSPSRYFVHKDPFRGRTPHELERLFDHSDPAGPIPYALTIAARGLVAGVWREREAPLTADWTPELAAALTRAVRGQVDGELVVPHDFEWGDATPPDVWFLVEDGELRGVGMRREDGSTRTRSMSVALLADALEAEEHLPADDRDRRLVRAILKATGQADRVSPDGTRVEVVTADGPHVVPPVTAE